MPVLVMIDQESGMTLSSVAPKKGANAYAILRLCNDLSLLGHAKLVLRSDNEPAILSLKEAAQADSSQKIEITGRVSGKSDQVIIEEICVRTIQEATGPLNPRSTEFRVLSGHSRTP